MRGRAYALPGSIPRSTNPRMAPKTNRMSVSSTTLLILIHPPLRKAEWRCSSGDWRAAPFGEAELIDEVDAPGGMPERRDPSLRGPNAGARPFGSFWGVCQKGLAVKAKPPASAPAETDIHPKHPEHGRPRGRQVQNPVKTLNTQPETPTPIETTKTLPHLRPIPHCAGAP